MTLACVRGEHYFERKKKKCVYENWNAQGTQVLVGKTHFSAAQVSHVTLKKDDGKRKKI